MKETIFEQVASSASVLKLDLSAEEFALFAEDREFSEAGMEAVQMLLGYLSEKKQQTTIQTLRTPGQNYTLTVGSPTP